MTTKETPYSPDRPGQILDLALISVAAVMIFFPAYRSLALKLVVSALFFVQSGFFIYKSWNTGQLSKTLSQIYQAIRMSGPPKGRRFENLAFFLGSVAMALVFWG
ncbi:MAG: hypothetical protein Q8N44_18175 [Rubrivivax sp.]|nr:hypothetical protein [Rubrivivax sp.]